MASPFYEIGDDDWLRQVFHWEKQYIMIKAQVSFRPDCPWLKELFDRAEATQKQNIIDYAGRSVLVEGGGYPDIWLETQPMGGSMYAKRDPQTALNNQLFFLEQQREDGRFPGLIGCREGKVIPRFTHIQGYCLPFYALELYYILGLDKDYLELLYQGLERFDNYLWAVRDSDGDGCLETWCVWDTGEDECSRFLDAPNEWPESTPPTGFKTVPIESMNYMSYSYDGRNMLSKISALLGNGKEAYWAEKAEEVRKKVREYLWREEKGACYDRDCNNEFMDTLFQGNIQAMHHGLFYQDMAERFVREHLLNPDEFWTPVPLPSIAINDPMYRDEAVNNWSGFPQSLTYQRAIRALENYGFYHELTLLGKKYLKMVAKNRRFTQQFDPYTGESSLGWGNGDYGPCILSVMEYVSRMYGIHLQGEEIFFGTDGGFAYEYTQVMGDRRYRVESDGQICRGFLDEKELFTVSAGTRVIADRSGAVKQVINTSAEASVVRFCGQERTLEKNEVWIIR